MRWFNHNGKHPHPSFKSKLTFGQRASDVVTTVFGSWAFIIFLFVFLLAWLYSWEDGTLIRLFF